MIDGLEMMWGNKDVKGLNFNEDYKDKQVDENGREYIDYWTCGGPCGGYMAPVYTDNDAVYSWRFEWRFDKRRLTHILHHK